MVGQVTDVTALGAMTGLTADVTRILYNKFEQEYVA